MKTSVTNSEKVDTDKMDLGPALSYLLSTVSHSANLCYRDISGLNDLQWGIVLRLHKQPQTSKEIQVELERDKGLVSRMLKSLEESNFLSKASLRSPYTLTTKGEELAQKLVTLAKTRNNQLLNGISENDLLWFYSVVKNICSNAQKLIAIEKETVTDVDVEYTETREAIKVYANPQLLFWLYRLFTLIRQYSSITFRGELGITGYQARVLVTVKHMQPLLTAHLAKTIRSDKSQVMRMVSELCEDGLLVKCDRPGKKRKDIMLTSLGYETYNRLAEQNKIMDKKLLVGVNQTERMRLSKLISKLILNAKKMY